MVPARVWDAVEKAEAGVLVRRLLLCCCGVCFRLILLVRVKDMFEQTVAVDFSLKPFAPVVSALHKGWSSRDPCYRKKAADSRSDAIACSRAILSPFLVVSFACSS